MDATADMTMGDSPTRGLQEFSQGLASHVIHEESIMAEAQTPTTTPLRPRPSPFARANSSSGGISSSNSNGSIQGGQGIQDAASTASGVTPSQARRALLVRNEAFENSPQSRPQYRHQISDVSIASNDGSVQLHVTPPPLTFGSETTISNLTYTSRKGASSTY